MTLRKVGWLEAGFVKVREAPQSPKLGVAFSKVLLSFPVAVTPPQVCLPETKQTSEGTFHDGNRVGRAESS